ELPNIIIGTGYVAHFPLLHQIIKCPECFLNWSTMIWLMSIIKIDVIGIQPFETVLHGLHNMLTGKARIIGAYLSLRAKYLSSKNYCLSFVFKGFSDDLFRSPS